MPKDRRCSNNNVDDFKDFVLDILLEKNGAVRDFYRAFHGDTDLIGEEEIEWFRKDYTGRKSPFYYFTFIACGEFTTHFVIHGNRDDVSVEDLYSYAYENYIGYVNEYFGGDEDAAPVFRYALIMMEH